MVFLGLVMMPFYYGSKVRSVPEYLRRRFNKPSHLFNAVAFSIAKYTLPPPKSQRPRTTCVTSSADKGRSEIATRSFERSPRIEPA